MAWRFVLQPNGLLAVFSEVVDSFTVYDMTPQAAFEYAIHEGHCTDSGARGKIDNAYIDNDPLARDGHRYYRANGDRLGRWTAALEIIAFRHGDAERVKMERLLTGGKVDPIIPSDAKVATRRRRRAGD